ncbi:MAG: hypothetical protein ACRD51_11530 [Candidatus Acidiferrum sp.]
MENGLKNAIEGLSHAEPGKREAFASWIYVASKTLTLEAVENWWTNEELSKLLMAPNAEVTVGVAVQREAFARIRAANGIARLAEVPSDQDAEEFELHFKGGKSLDILTSRAPGGDGAIAKYLAKFGEGVQQVEFRCLDVDRATEILKAKFKIAAIYPEPRAGADGTRVNFFLLPLDGGGKVLVELYEAAGKHDKQ